MPFITVHTNLSSNQLPDNFMNKFTEYVSKTIGRDVRLFNWTFESGKNMSKGINNERLSYMQVRIEAFEVFDDAEKTSKAIPHLFSFLTKETCLNQDEIHIILYPIPLWRIGADGKAITEVPKF